MWPDPGCRSQVRGSRSRNTALVGPCQAPCAVRVWSRQGDRDADLAESGMKACAPTNEQVEGKCDERDQGAGAGLLRGLLGHGRGYAPGRPTAVRPDPEPVR